MSFKSGNKFCHMIELKAKFTQKSEDGSIKIKSQMLNIWGSNLKIKRCYWCQRNTMWHSQIQNQVSSLNSPMIWIYNSNCLDLLTSWKASTLSKRKECTLQWHTTITILCSRQMVTMEWKFWLTTLRTLDTLNLMNLWAILSSVLMNILQVNRKKQEFIQQHHGWWKNLIF